MSAGPSSSLMSTRRPPLPEYAHPPIVAATLGVIAGDERPVSEALLADYQSALGPEWIGEWKLTSAVDQAIVEGLLPLGWHLSNVLGDRRVQVHDRRFDFTWLGADDGRYPRYENLRDGFVAAWDLWSELHGPANVQHWTVSYLNRIPQGTVWQTPADWRFLTWLGPAAGSALQESPESFSAQWKFPLSDAAGHLVIDIELTPVSDGSTTPCLWLRLTAEGPLTTTEPASLFDGMDLGRTAIVQTFSDLMSPAANAYWGLRRREK